MRGGRAKLLLAVCVLLCAVGVTVVLVLTRPPTAEPQTSDTDVPLGVEQALIIRYSGPRLAARPYRRGASVNVRIANEAVKGNVRIYDVRYVVSLPGEFDVTGYLTSADGRPIDDLPAFRVRGLTSLTKDIETRIREIENVGVDLWHWYHETLVGLGVLWVAWLLGLIFVGRPKRPPLPPPVAPQPSLAEQIDGLIAELREGELTVAQRARLETLLLEHWRRQLQLADQPMAVSCRRVERSSELGPLYRRLQGWLHDGRSGVGRREFLEAYARHTEPESPAAAR